MGGAPLVILLVGLVFPIGLLLAAVVFDIALALWAVNRWWRDHHPHLNMLR